jgi:hypothetical protein
MDITDLIIDSINNYKPISFSKYGDGEYFCAFGYNGHNCDKDNYTPKLREALIKSFKYVTDGTNNNYIGKWPNDSQINDWQKLVSQPIKYAKYHTLIFDEVDDHKKVEIYKTIKKSKLKKIIVCNESLKKSKLLLDADELIIIPFNNWFDNQFDNVLNNLKNVLGNSNNHIVITSCGMSAKVLICELLKLYPNGIYLDFGSALDKICTKIETRAFTFSYEYLKKQLHELLPVNWD